jgi:hypothetical protein
MSDFFEWEHSVFWADRPIAQLKGIKSSHEPPCASISKMRHANSSLAGPAIQTFLLEATD